VMFVRVMGGALQRAVQLFFQPTLRCMGCLKRCTHTKKLPNQHVFNETKQRRALFARES
jgi:hypothetical protein